MKIFSFISFATMLSFQTFAQTAEPSNDAKKLYMQQNPYADFSDETTRKRMIGIDVEIAALKKAIFTDAAGKAIFDNKLPFEDKVVILGFKDQFKQIISGLASGLEVDLSQPTGITAFDALNDKYEAVRLYKRYDFSSSWNLEIKQSQNMRNVAKEYAELGELDFAEVNGLNVIGGGAALSRQMVNYQPVYVMNLGWGDCPSGCINNSRTYIEVAVLDPILTYDSVPRALVVPSLQDINMYPRQLGEVRVLVETVGRAGSELSTEMRTRVFRK